MRSTITTTDGKTLVFDHRFGLPVFGNDLFDALHAHERLTAGANQNFHERSVHRWHDDGGAPAREPA